ncbi:hypothetical protein LOTGIDRAFT_56344, partial [Lottia gigantea]
DTDLSNFGLEQAQLVANRLRNERFTHVYTSDLTRAAGTAQTIVDTNKVCKCPLIKDKRLRERKFGVVEGKTYREFALEARKENIALPAFTPRGGEKVEQVVTDGEIKMSITCPKYTSTGCPNVSLSPLLEKRFSSISSASSGRNNSFDESDNQQCIADILIVSHGGFLKEFIRHFIEDLHCKIPGGKCYALRVGPNTSMSKFTVSFENGCDKPVVTCLLIHDKDHLRNL